MALPLLLGCGMTAAWAAWTSMPDLTDTLVTLTRDPHLFIVVSVHMQRLKRFAIFMYSKGCGAAGVKAARHQLFTTGSNILENTPPTQAILPRMYRQISIGIKLRRSSRIFLASVGLAEGWQQYMATTIVLRRDERHGDRQGEQIA